MYSVHRELLRDSRNSSRVTDGVPLPEVIRSGLENDWEELPSRQLKEVKQGTNHIQVYRV